MRNSQNIATELEYCLAEDGIRGALTCLNKRVTHRFTALHIKDLDALKKVYVFDRDDPEATPFMNLPVHETFCALVFATGQPLVINNAAQEARLLQSAQTAPIKSYCGLPLHRPDGSIFGTLCHYDFQPRDISPAELEVQQTASHLLSATLNNISSL